MENDDRLNGLLALFIALNDVYKNVEPSNGSGGKVVFSMLTTTFNNICDLLNVPNNNTNK